MMRVPYLAVTLIPRVETASSGSHFNLPCAFPPASEIPHLDQNRSPLSKRTPLLLSISGEPGAIYETDI